MSIRAPQQGFVLVAVLVVVMLGSMLALSLTFRMTAEEAAAQAGFSSDQAWSVLMSGVSETMDFVRSAEAGSLEWQEDADRFRDRLVLEDGDERWYYSVFTRSDPSLRGIRFGVRDEASKLHLDRVEGALLEKIPGLTAPLRDALLALAGVAPSATNVVSELELAAAPVIQRGRLSLIDDLLTLPGFTAEVVYGREAPPQTLAPAAIGEGPSALNIASEIAEENTGRGLRDYLTVMAYEPNRNNRGEPRLNLNDPAADLSKLPFAEVLTNYLAAARQQKQTNLQPADLLEGRLQAKDSKGVVTELSSGIGREELGQLLDECTGTGEQQQVGLVNVNTAPREVLQVLPEVDEALAESILSLRVRLGPEQRATPAWLYQEGLVDAVHFRKLAPFLTARSYQFSFEVVAYSLPSGRYRVAEVTVDLAGARPVITAIRDRTRRGLPFAVNTPEEEETNG